MTTSNKPDPKRFHPGKRYGKNLEPQLFDNPEHATWHLAKDQNWGCWSCCGNAVGSLGCHQNERPIQNQPYQDLPANFTKRIRFIKEGNVHSVISRNEK
jgi:hypothetical protein